MLNSEFEQALEEGRVAEVLVSDQTLTGKLRTPDAKGKTMIVLVNDPGFASGNSKLFNGRTMTYYGR